MLECLLMHKPDIIGRLIILWFEVGADSCRQLIIRSRHIYAGTHKRTHMHTVRLFKFFCVILNENISFRILPVNYR